jgi:hypothetical protein
MAATFPLNDTNTKIKGEYNSSKQNIITRKSDKRRQKNHEMYV